MSSIVRGLSEVLYFLTISFFSSKSLFTVAIYIGH
ncbi:hypothetical protein JOC61_000478 [Marinitoga litoralis]|nr:hypothetical protein [Marinitoga litoralis]